MYFTNENPCTYYYTSDDDNFSFDLDHWIGNIIPRRRMQGEAIYQKQNDPNGSMYNIPVKLSLEELEKERLAFSYYNSGKFNENGSPLEMSIEEAQHKLYEEAKLVAPKAFDIIKQVHTNGVNRMLLTYVGEISEYKAYGHFHPHILNQDGTKNRECKTCVVMVPLNHTMPVTERVFFNHQDIVNNEEEEIIEACRKTASPYDKPRGNVVDLLMPSMGQYLVVEFLSSRCLHWLENYGTTNEYLCIIAEN